jgi:hypothetical protein
MAEHRSFRLTITPKDNPASGGEYQSALAVAAAQQAIILLLAALILDGGVVLRFCTIAAIASWICTLMIMLRRPKQPTILDLGIVKYGFWPAMFLVTVIGFVINSFVR